MPLPQEANHDPDPARRTNERPAAEIDDPGMDAGEAEAGPGGERPASLTSDLKEVRRGRPERAFNVGAAVGIAVTVAVVIFVVQNNQSTQFDWLWFDFSLPLWTALVGAVVFGIVLAVGLLAVRRRRQQRIRNRDQAADRLHQALVPDGEPEEPATDRSSPDRAPQA